MRINHHVCECLRTIVTYIPLRISRAQPEGCTAVVGGERWAGRASRGSPATGICSPASIGGRALVRLFRADCRLCRAASKPSDASVCSRCTKCVRHLTQHPSNQVQHAAGSDDPLHAVKTTLYLHTIRQTSPCFSDWCHQYAWLQVGLTKTSKSSPLRCSTHQILFNKMLPGSFMQVALTHQDECPFQTSQV